MFSADSHAYVSCKCITAGIEWATLENQTPPTLEPNLPPLSGDASASDPAAPATGGQSGSGPGGSSSSAEARAQQLETGLSDAQFARLIALQLTDEFADSARIRGESNCSDVSAGVPAAPTAAGSGAGAPAPAPVPDQ